MNNATQNQPVSERNSLDSVHDIALLQAEKQKVLADASARVAAIRTVLMVAIPGAPGYGHLVSDSAISELRSVLAKCNP